MRGKMCLIAVVALAATTMTLAFSSGATAGVGGIVQSYYTDPQNTNVPYLAWDGEQIRLVKCFTLAELGPVAGSARFVIEDWSGVSYQKPVFENSGVSGTDGTAFPFAGAGAQAG